ncbi:MAG TPA: type IV pilus secretin PilQ [Terriglobia bacterium]
MKSRGGFLLFLLSTLFVGAAAGASGKLLELKTTVDPQGTTLLLRLPTPVVYSPTQVSPKVYLVDLKGVSTDRNTDSQAVESPLVSSYRLFSYQGADAQPHVGLELTLKEEASVRPTEVPDGLQIRVEPASAKPAAAASAGSVSLREVSVIQPEGGAGLEVEILADGDVTYKTEKLSNPDRLVVDLPNTVNRIRQTHLAVNTSPLKAVRIGQFRKDPPVSRVVMDLESQVPFMIRRQPKGLIISLNAVPSAAAAGKAGASADLAARATEKPAQPVKLATSAPQRKPGLAAAKETAKAGVSEKSAASSGAALKATEPVLVASNSPAALIAPVAPKPEPEIVAPAAGLSSVHAFAAETSPVEKATSEIALTTVPEPEPLGTGEAFAARPAGELPAPTVPSATAPKPVLMAQVPSAAAAALTVARQQASPASYTGEPISLDLKDVDLKDFFRLMHEVSGLNIVLDPNVAGVLTITLEEVPWDQAMDVVLKNNQLGKEVVGNVVRIARLSTLEGEEKQRLALAQAVELAQPRETVTRTLSYALAANLVTPLKRFLSQRGDIVPDPRTNTLIITDIPDAIAQIDRLIGNLDRKTSQVEIEARIVAASRSFARDIGVQLAASGSSGNVTLGGTGLVGESPILRGSVPPLFIGEPPEPPAPGELPKFAGVAQPLAVNLGAVGATSGFTFLISGGQFALDNIITAAESRGLGKLLSRPKVITQNNVEASVQQGVRIPIQTSVNNTISVQFVNVVLRLTVTPQITSDGTIFLKTDIENTTINPGIPRILGVPALNTQGATTQVLVSDGGTVFFGGVIQTDNNLTEQQVPLLGSIPLVGNLFRRKATSTTTNELLFFITPKVAQT